MKSIIPIFSLLSVLLLFSISCSATPIIKKKTVFKENTINAPIRVSVDLISAVPCDDGTFKAKVRVNVYATYGSTEHLVASQETVIPCGTIKISFMTRSDFGNVATKVGTKGVSLVTDYLDENDEDGTIMKEVAITLDDKMKSLKK